MEANRVKNAVMAVSRTDDNPIISPNVDLGTGECMPTLCSDSGFKNDPTDPFTGKHPVVLTDEPNTVSLMRSEFK